MNAVKGTQFPAISASNPLLSLNIQIIVATRHRGIMHLASPFCLLLCLFTPWVSCWGEIGHRTIGYLAEKYFDQAGAALVEELIAPDKKFDISDAAVWADLQKWKWPYTKPWHFVDAKDDPPAACGVNYNSDCPEDDGCIIGAIRNMVTSPHLLWLCRIPHPLFTLFFSETFHLTLFFGN